MQGKSPETQNNVKKGLSQVAYDAVVGMIFSRELPGGAIIQERKLAEVLGISRTPMREALGRLEGEGLVVRLTERLLSVRVVSLEEYLKTLHVRLVLESEAIALATPRFSKATLHDLRERIQGVADDEPSMPKHWAVDSAMHEAIADASGNPVLARIIRELRTITQLFEIQTIPTRAVPGYDDLLAVLDAIGTGDAAKARKAMKSHLDQARKGVVDEL